MADELNLETATLEQIEAEMDRVLGTSDEPIEPPITIVGVPPKEESQPEPTEETKTEEEKPESETAPEPDLDQEMLKAKESEWEARAKHWEQIAGRHGSELGQLRKVIQEMQARHSRTEQSPDDDTQDAPAENNHKSSTEDPFRAWALQQAILAGYQSFQSGHSDANEYETGIKKYLEDTGYDAKNVLLASDPAYAQNEINRVLTEAYWKVKADAQAARAAELREKKASQTAALHTAKQRASTSATASTPAPRTAEKDIKDMSIQELEAALEKETGGRWKG